MKNITAWSLITLAAIGLAIAGQYGAAFVLLAAVGIYDLRRVATKQRTITSYIRNYTPKWADWPLMILLCFVAWLVGGVPMLVVAVAYTCVGHFFGHE